MLSLTLNLILYILEKDKKYLIFLELFFLSPYS